MATRDAIRDNVKSWLRNRSDVSNATIEEEIYRTCLSLSMGFDFPALQYTQSISTVIGTGTYALDSAMQAVRLVRDEYNDQIIPQRTIEDYEAITDKTEQGTPDGWTRWGNNLLFYPVPDFADTITVRGVRLHPTFADGSTEPSFPEDWHLIVELLTASRLAFRLGMSELAMEIKNEALAEISTRQEIRTYERRWHLEDIGQIDMVRKSVI
jgi:hypothetical protein